MADGAVRSVCAAVHADRGSVRSCVCWTQLALGERGRYLAITDDGGSVHVIETSGAAQAKRMKKKHSNVWQLWVPLWWHCARPDPLRSM